ncbi:GNS1/SUR4 family-domain-containing protein [Myxozyma melibiosi]|uniref:Elongation of fatty acids protein n=1 Tax=Myxozyma melibiosi TaxID=54550 RepID=A0ABR1F0A6_9ASCO
MDTYIQAAKDYLEPQPPSVDRPFGIHVWAVFSDVCNRVLKWNPDAFEFVQDELPLSTLTPMIATIVAYYVIILGGRELMRPFAPWKLTFLFRVHNIMLTFVSWLLLTLFIEQLFPIIYRHGLFYAICNAGSWTQPMVTLYYLNYLTKFVELIDTVFLVVKKKPLTFLHCFHHGATAALCYSQIVGHTSVSWVVITLNLGVHVVMYFYYFLSSCGIRVWWKEWVTRLQIIQFIIDLGFVYFASYTYFTSTYWPHMPNYGECAGEEFAAIYGCGLLTSYLFLFIAFYIRVYAKGKARSAAKRKAAAAAAAAGASEKKSVTNGKEAEAASTPVKAAKKSSSKKI